MSDILKWAGIGALVYILLGAGSRAVNNVTSKITTGPIGIKFKGITWQGANVQIQIPVINKYSVGFPIDGVSGFIMAGNLQAARIDVPEPFTIEANSETVVTANTFIGFDKLAGNIQQIIESGNIPTNLRFDGYIKAGGVNIPVQRKIQLI